MPDKLNLYLQSSPSVGIAHSTLSCGRRCYGLRTSLSTSFNPCPRPLIGQECWMFEDASLWHTIYRTTICCITMYRNIWNHRHRVTCMVPVSRVGQVFGSQLKTASGITVFTQYCAMWKSGKRRPDYKLSKERWWLADTQ